MDKVREQIRNWFYYGLTIAFVIMCILVVKFGMGRAVDVRLFDMAIKTGWVLMFTLPILSAYIGYRRVR